MKSPRLRDCRLNTPANPPIFFAPPSARSSALPVSPEVYRRSVSTVLPPTAVGVVLPWSAMLLVTPLNQTQPQIVDCTADRRWSDRRAGLDGQRCVVLALAVRQRRHVLLVADLV